MTSFSSPAIGTRPALSEAASDRNPSEANDADPTARFPRRAARVGITPRSIGAYARLVQLPERRHSGLLSRISAFAQVARRRFNRRR